MNWIFYALLSPLFWGTGNVIDSLIRNKHVRDSYFLGIAGGLSSAVIAIWLLFQGIKVPELPYLILALTPGLIWAVTTIVYYHLLSIEEASRLVPISQISSLFILIISIAFLGEKLNWQGYIAFTLLLAGAILLGIKKVKGLFKASDAIKLIIFNSLLYAISIVLLKQFYTTYDINTGLFWTSIATATGSSLFLLSGKIRTNIKAAIPKLKKNIVAALIVSLTLGIAGKLTLNYALQSGPASLVSVLGGTQGVFVLILTTIVARFRPGMLKEVYEKKTLLIKAAAIVLIIAGLWLLNA